MPLLSALLDPQFFITLRQGFGAKLLTYQPYRLEQERKQKEGSQKLWTSETFRREI